VFTVDASAAGTAELVVAVVELENKASLSPLDNMSVVRDNAADTSALIRRAARANTASLSPTALSTYHDLRSR